MSNEQEQGSDVVRSCAISQDLEAYPLLIQEMQQQFGENWGGLELEDAISVLHSSHAAHMESLVMAIGAKDEQHIDLIIANDVSNTRVFGHDTNKVYVIDKKECEEWPEQNKKSVAFKIADRICDILSCK